MPTSDAPSGKLPASSARRDPPKASHAMRVATQWNAAFNKALQRELPAIDLIPVGMGSFEEFPKDVAIMAAAPFRRFDGEFMARPSGWPFALQWVQLVSVGLDSYPDWLFEVPTVTNARGSSAVALAEFAIASILAAAKRFPDIWIDGAERWAPVPLDILNGRTLGLLGFGAAAERLAPIAIALGMEVLALRRSDKPIALPGVIRVADAGELFERADHLVLAAPATPATVGLVNDDLLSRAKRGQHLINIARGSLIDNDALLRALDDGRLSRATLDVTQPEPLPANHPFYTHPGIRLSPHTSIFTPDTVNNLATQFARNLGLFARGQPLENVIDPARTY